MSDDSRYLHPREELLQAMERIYRYRMTTTSGGNLSIREHNGNLWITPARVDKGSLRREDIVCVLSNGDIEGIRKPSSELPIHQEIRVRRRNWAALCMLILRRSWPSALCIRHRIRASSTNRTMFAARWDLLHTSSPGARPLANV